MKVTLYFDMDVTTSEKTYRAVCFCKNRYPLFAELNETAKGCCIKRTKRSESNDIIITDFSKIEVAELEFDRVTKAPEITKIQTVINEFSLFERVNVKGIVSDISPVKTTEIKPVQFVHGLIHDSSGTCRFTLFGNQCHTIINNKSYLCTHFSLSKYKSERILKSTEVSKVIETPLDDSFKLSDRPVVKRVEEIVCKIVTVNLSSMIIQTLCPLCKMEVKPDDDVALCDHCNNIIALSSCLKNNKVKCLFLDVADNVKHDLLVPFDLLSSVTNESPQEKIKFVKSIMSLLFSVEYDQSDMLVTSLRIADRKQNDIDNEKQDDIMQDKQ